MTKGQVTIGSRSDKKQPFKNAFYSKGFVNPLYHDENVASVERVLMHLVDMKELFAGKGGCL